MTVQDKQPVTKMVLVEGLRRLGLHRDMSIMVHSSLKSFGYVDGGAQTVIMALTEILTSNGTVMLPSFNHGAPFRPNGPGYFAGAETPTTNGIIPETFRQLPGVRRSLHPTHAFAAWGKNADVYTTHHHRALTMGWGSPLHRLVEDGGFCLCIGVGLRSNTFHHVVEQCRNVPCLGARTEAYPMRLSDGRTVMGRAWGWRAQSCPLTDGGCYHEAFLAAGLHRETTIGKSRVILYRYLDCVDFVARILHDGYRDFPPCSRCPIRPRRGSNTVPSDWDTERNCLKPDSSAWTY